MQLQTRELEQERIFPRIGGGMAPETATLHLGEVGIFQLINAFQNVIKRLEAREDLQEITGENFTVSDKIERILQTLADGKAIKFSELFARMASRIEIVVTFLALLELIRLKQVRAIQPNEFDEIELAPVAR
jgi:segregation and condensation protein A